MCGFLELKLHDDLGDLELWLASVNNTTGGADAPLDFPADTVVRVAFPSHGGRVVNLRVRNREDNEDEDGVANMRVGRRTNYFIFPGESGEDAAWLCGQKWRGVAEVAFSSGGFSYACAPFVLVPHCAL